jgi:hypothetical protein
LIGAKLLLNAEELCGWLEHYSVNALLRQLHGIKTDMPNCLRWRYMDTPLLSVMFQVVVGGVLVFLASRLIGMG